jgi:hypothetical protein
MFLDTSLSRGGGGGGALGALAIPDLRELAIIGWPPILPRRIYILPVIIGITQ